MAARVVTRGQAVIDFIEGWCKVPEGKLVGQPVRLLPFQKQFILDIYDNPHGTQQAILSVGRKNGKTALCAFLMLAHLVGPEAFPNSQLYSAAQSKEQAALLFDLAVKTIRMDEDLMQRVVIRESTKTLYAPAKGTRYRALSAEAGTAFGASPIFVLHDELGQVAGERSPLYEALETAQQAHENPLSIVISTQAPNDSALLSILIDDAVAGHDKSTVICVYSAEDEVVDKETGEVVEMRDPFDEETIKMANPAYGEFQNAHVVLKMADRARRMPSREAFFRNLILNQRVETEDPLVTKLVWDRNAGKPEGWEVCYGGLDLSKTTDLTAFVLVSPVDGIVNVRSKFWIPGDDLEERARQDRTPYDLWAEQGYIDPTPGRSVSYKAVAEYLKQSFDENDIRYIAFDRWNMKNLTPWLLEAGLSEAFIEDRFIPFGQGFQSMSPAIRVAEELWINAKMRHGAHPVLTRCASNTVVKADEAGNRKLDKKRSKGRIDGMVALVMACSAMEGDKRAGKALPVAPEDYLVDLSGSAAVA